MRNGEARARIGLGLATGLLWWAGVAVAATVSLHGKVCDGSGAGLGAIQIRAFVDGLVQGSAVSGPDGQYAIEFPYAPEADQTIVIWWIPAQAGLVPEILLLRESRRAVSLQLWSRCLPRRELSADLSYDAVLRTEEEKLKLLGPGGCLEADR